MLNNKPIILTDLDDTLFQTKRKFEHTSEFSTASVGAFDRQQKARSFMTASQKNMVDWLLATTVVIPVTARGSDDIQRITIPFHSYMITTHGAVILDKNNQPHSEWQAHIQQQLAPYTQRLLALEKQLSALLAQPEQHPHLPNVAAWCRMNYEYNQPVYLVMKVNNSAHIKELNLYADWIEKSFDLTGFYVHRNDNNIAWLPQCIEKGHAVQFLLHKLQVKQRNRPVIGIGDSLSDYSFMKQCDFMAIPKRSQFMQKIHKQLFTTG